MRMVPLPPNAGTWSMILQLAKQLGLFWAACAALYLLYRMMRGIFHWSGWGSVDTGSGGNWAAYGPFGGGASSASNGGGSGSAGARRRFGMTVNRGGGNLSPLFS